MQKKLPSGNWRVRAFCGYDKNGKQIIKSFTADTRWKAEKMADDYINDNKRNRDILTVGEAVSGYISIKENVLSPSTIKGYMTIRRTRLQCLMNIDVNELNSFKMQQAINTDAVRYESKSINEAKNLVLTALKMYGVKPDINVTLPPKKPKFKELPTAEKVLEIILGSDVELPCLLAMWLSLRMSEVRGLQFRDIKNGVLTVQRSRMYLDGKDVVREVNKTFKSSRRLVLPLHIRELIEKIPHNSNEDFIVDYGYSYIKGHFDRLMKKNGIKMTFHDLRHLNASIMLKLGIPNKYAMERGGWSTDNVLKSVYQHTFSDERKLVDDKIDKFFNGIVDTIKAENEIDSVN